MNAPLKILAAAVCGLLLGLPAAQADDYWPMTDIYVQFGTEENELRAFPRELTLHAGELYRFVAMNPSESTHILAAPEFQAAALTADLVVQAAELNQFVVINPGETAYIVALPGSELGPGELTTDILEWSPRVDYPTASIRKGIMVGPGQMLEWTFMPIKEGRYKFGCAIPFHADADMHAMIEVVDEVL